MWTEDSRAKSGVSLLILFAAAVLIAVMASVLLLYIATELYSQLEQLPYLPSVISNWMWLRR